MDEERTRKLALAILCFNIILALLGALLAWNSQRQAVTSSAPTDLALVITTPTAASCTSGGAFTGCSSSRRK